MVAGHGLPPVTAYSEPESATEPLRLNSSNLTHILTCIFGPAGGQVPGQGGWLAGPASRWLRHCWSGLVVCQRKCIEFALKARPQQRYVPTMKFQWRIWQLVTSRGFEYCLFTLIIINTVALAMKVLHRHEQEH